MTDMPQEIQQLFRDILNKMSIYEQAATQQTNLSQVVNKMAQDVNNLSNNFDNFKTNIVGKIKDLDDWKSGLDKIVSQNDIEKMKNKYDNMSLIEHRLESLQKELTDEIRKDIKHLESKVTNNDLKEKVAALEEKMKHIDEKFGTIISKSLLTGGGAGAGIAAVAATVAAILRSFGHL